MKTGLVSVTFRQLSCESIIELVKQAELDGIEWGGDVHVPCGDLERARVVGEATRNAGLEVACYGSYCRLTDEEKEDGIFEATVQTAKALGAPLIRVWAGKEASAGASDAAFLTVAENAAIIARLAANEGIDIAYEYHAKTLTDSIEASYRLLSLNVETKVYSLWQPPVDTSREDCLQSIEKIAPYIRNIHVYSWRGRERMPLEWGLENWQRYFEVIKKLPGERYALLEFVAGDEPAQFMEDARTLKSWLS